jgi:UDP-galactopyranose mutase
MARALILGGGFAGTTAAYLLKREGWDVTLVEKEAYLGGGCRTWLHAGHPFTYGPRVYYGYSQSVFDWVNKFVPIRRFPFELRTLAHEPMDWDRRFWSYPPHEEDIAKYPRGGQILVELEKRDNSVEPVDFEDYWLRKVGPTIYDMFVDHYSKKMWMIGDNRIFDIFKWSAKDRPLESGTREAYKGSLLGYPRKLSGYNDYFDAMVDGVNVELSRIERRYPWLDDRYQFDAIISTIPIDELCGHELGELPYVGRDFHLLVLPCKQVFPGDVRFCHYASPRDEWTRVTEFKKITYHEAEDTLLVLEKPSKANKLYPYLTKANEAKVREYMALLPPNVHSIGRLGTYKYSTIEQTIVQAFACVAKILGKPSAEGIEGEWRGIGDVSMMKDRREDGEEKEVAKEIARAWPFQTGNIKVTDKLMTPAKQYGHQRNPN